MKQLLYGSADGIAGRAGGGWGVIRATDGIDPQTQQALSSLASVMLRQTMPQFPSADELSRRVRRFRARPTDGAIACCMSVEAGPDHTGRPGNVISHCALVPGDGKRRTTDWYFAEGWVLPHGPHQVAQASLPDELTHPSGWVATARWLRSEPSRIQRARFVVGAGVRALAERRPLLLVADSVESGAHWASAVLWMLPASVAQHYAVYLGEDARSMSELKPSGAYIAMVGRDVEVPETLAQGVVDTTADGPDDPDWGQLIADLLLQSDDVASDVFARRDELYERYVEQGLRERFTMAQALQVAWYTRANAHNFGQEEAIAELLEQVGPSVRAWPEMAGLARSAGVAAQGGASPVEEAYGTDNEPYADLTQNMPARPAGQGPMQAAHHERTLTDEALEAAARLASLDVLRGDWLGLLDSAPEQTRADWWSVAAVASWVVPEPGALVAALQRFPDVDPRAARALAERSRAHYGDAEELQQVMGGTPWQ